MKKLLPLLLLVTMVAISVPVFAKTHHPHHHHHSGHHFHHHHA